MQYDAKTPAEYLDMLEADWRKERLLELCALIHKLGPELEEMIRYKALSYSGSKGGAFGCNAQKNSVNLYVGDIRKVDPDGALLAGLNTGKGCVRFTKTVIAANTNSEAFIAKAMNMWRNGEYFGC